MQKVCYLFNQDFTSFQLSKKHPMRPMRLNLVNSLINTYNLANGLNIFQSRAATSEDLCRFHHPQYVNYLETWVSPKASSIVAAYDSDQIDEATLYKEDRKLGEVFKINEGFDCPGFEGLFDYCQLSAGSSIDAAHLLITGEGDIAINWMGGYHHARKSSASGFCYINDIVLCILELLKVYQRVLYLDIDVHHGDGVEEAFLHTNRVMTVSFHQFEPGFFPETGSLESIGEEKGKYYTVNVPLKKGMDNQSYVMLFERVMNNVMNVYRPDVIVMQCGADSLSKDELGDFHLSIKGHARCLQHMKSFGMPMVLLGGGGYTIQNVSRCWAYETGRMLGHEIDNEIPEGDQYRYFYYNDCYQIHFDVKKNATNTNPSSQIEQIERTIANNLKNCEARPNVGFHEAPKLFRSQEKKERMTEEEKGRYFPNS